MNRVFVDASVFYSACLSATGASREILLRGLRQQLVLVVSDVVREETERNLSHDHPEVLPLLTAFWDLVPFEIVSPTTGQVEAAAVYTKLKDAPIVAAAKAAGIDYLVSLDRKDLVDNADVVRESGLAIVLPGQLMIILRQQDESVNIEPT